MCPTIRRIDDQWRVVANPGAAPDRLVPENPDQRELIWVVAVPSSGTSCVAGILHHLGVNMGKVENEANHNRGYQMFEDVNVGMFAFVPNSPLDRLLNQRIRLREYCHFRAHSDPAGPIGVKTLPTAWAYDDDPASLPVKLIDVRRPLEDSINADQERMASRPLRDRQAVPAQVFEHWNRAGGVAGLSVARDQLLSIIQPKLTLEYYEVLANPSVAITEICGAFGLEPTDQQYDDAMRFVQPKMRTV
jgi:hypothetical protein